jgi:23S rRNA pseudouridine1911/1915/1917 synthase
LIRLKPLTGRTHQLRVHLSTKGHPIVGDTMYGGLIMQADDWRFARQALHAARIRFTHPRTMQPVTISAPLPADIERLLAGLRRTSQDSGEQSGPPSV